VPFDTGEDAVRELRRAGFDQAAVRRATEVLGATGKRGEQLVHIIEAATFHADSDSLQ
jgi:hypothetical protein